MATIVHILVALIEAVLRVFVSVFLLLVSSAVTLLLGLAIVIGLILVLTGTVGIGIFRRRR